MAYRYATQNNTASTNTYLYSLVGAECCDTYQVRGFEVHGFEYLPRGQE